MEISENFTSKISKMSEKQLKEYIHTVGKAANQRLRELEKRGLESSSAAYRYVNALARDGEDIAMSRTGTGQIKFNLRVRGLTIQELRHVAATIDRFTQGRTSTVTGVKNALQKAYDTFQDTFGDQDIDFTDFATAMANTLFRQFEKIFGSKTAVKILNYGYEQGLSEQEIMEALEQAGFTVDTDETGAPSLSMIYNAIDNFADEKKELEGGEDGLFDDEL